MQTAPMMPTQVLERFLISITKCVSKEHGSHRQNNFTVEIQITLSTALEEAREIEGIENDNGDDDAEEA